MSIDGEETILVCTRVEDGPQVPGFTARCLVCAAVVTISPATFAKWLEVPAPKSIRCGPCWFREMREQEGTVQIMAPTPGQLAEIREVEKRERGN